jgi:uncharacterized membrane protein
MWYMNSTSAVGIDAPASTVWDVYTDVERWPEWTPSVERIVPLDGPELALGHRFEIKQPRLPKVVWEVTALEPGVSWTWRARSVGNTTFASHEVAGQDENHTVVRQRIEQRGPVGAAVGVLMLRLTKRYLALESDGLKARSEERARQDAASA